MRWLAGGLLILAALLKAVESYLHPADALASGPFPWSWNRIAIPVHIGGELGLGLAALLGVYWRQLRWFAIGLFAIFCLYTLSLALRGIDSCGCLGPVAVNPWLIFCLDTVVLTGLVAEARRYPAGYLSGKVGIKARKTGLPYSLGITIFSAVLAGSLAWFAVPSADVTKDGLLLPTVGSLTILEPEKWIGKTLPIENSIDIEVSHGQWILVLHQHDCSKCAEAIPQYEQLAARNPELRVALIEVPPLDGQQKEFKNCLYGHLDNRREWFVQTPVEIQLVEGKVLQASYDLPTLEKDTQTKEVFSLTQYYAATLATAIERKTW